MKKVLLATSAFALMAGAASAEIALSGSARMGLVYSDTAAGSSTQFSSRVRIVFTASGETDTGLSFGASMRADQLGQGNTSNGDSTVYISGAFGKLTMGDVSGAADALVGQTSGVGYGPNDGLHEIDFIGTTKTAAYYEYSTGGFTFGLGAGQRAAAGATAAEELSVAVKYSAGNYSVALGWETTDGNTAAPATYTGPVAGVTYAEDLISASASATFGAATVKAKIADSDINGKDTTWSLSLDYVTGATTITGFYTDFGNTKVAGNDTQHVGLGVAYDLGGGATLAAGIVQQNNNVATDNTFADVGLKFSF
ncbi:MAG: porin [Tabrizicola sp.]